MIRYRQTLAAVFLSFAVAGLCAGAAPTVVSVTPSSGAGLTREFAFSFSDADGAADIDYVRFLFSTAGEYKNSCYLMYSPATNTLKQYTTDAFAVATAAGNAQCAANPATVVSTLN